MTRVYQCRNPHCSDDRPGPFDFLFPDGSQMFPLIVQWTDETLRACPHCGSTVVSDEGDLVEEKKQ